MRVQGVHDELVDGLEEVEHLHALLAEDLQMRVQLEGLAAGAEGEVDLLLVRFGAGDVLLKRDEPLGVVAGAGVEAQQAGEGLAVGEVHVAGFEHAGVLAPEFGVLVLVLGHFGQLAEQLLGEGGADFADEQVVLQGLAADVQRQVLGVHHAAYEHEILRDEVLVLALDEHTADVEVEAPVLVVEAHEVLALLRDEAQGAELHRRVDAGVQHVHGLFFVIGEEGVKFLVLFLGDLELGLAPQGGHGVGAFAIHQDGEADEV